MNRRLEGPRFDAGRLETTGHQARQAENTRTHAINRQQLKRIRKSADGTQEAASASQANGPDQERSQAAHAGQSLDEILIDFVMPHLPEQAILRRSVAILQHCVTDLIPTLEGGDQLKGLAQALMDEEIERHRVLLGKLQGGSET